MKWVWIKPVPPAVISISPEHTEPSTMETSKSCISVEMAAEFSFWEQNSNSKIFKYVHLYVSKSSDLLEKACVNHVHSCPKKNKQKCWVNNIKSWTCLPSRPSVFQGLFAKQENVAWTLKESRMTEEEETE